MVMYCMGMVITFSARLNHLGCILRRIQPPGLPLPWQEHPTDRNHVRFGIYPGMTLLLRKHANGQSFGRESRSSQLRLCPDRLAAGVGPPVRAVPGETGHGGPL